MDSEEVPNIIKQAFPADEGIEPNQEDFFILDSDAQDSQDLFQFVPNRLQAILTLQWLSQHYEAIEGVSLPRCLIYKHYSDFCFKNQFPPVNAASFGKVIRQVFPELRTRRLGTRGQSKYHYYGIRVKESSPYFGVFLDSQRVSSALYRFPAGLQVLSSQTQLENPVILEQSDNPSTPMTSIFTLLPEFPTAIQMQPWGNLTFEQVDSVTSQYRCHCQQVIESIIRGKLNEVPMQVRQFWVGLPDSTKTVLQGGCDKLADLIALCDNILHHTMINILIPGTVQQLPPNLLQAVRHFSCTFQKVIEESLPNLSEYLHLKQVETAKRFCQLLKRKTSLSHLAQATRVVLKTKVSVTQMCHDWRSELSRTPCAPQLMWTIPGVHPASRRWSRNAGDEPSVKEEAERDFLLQWSYVCNLLIRDQTLRSATSFGSFHLLHLLYEEYLLYMVDVQRNQKEERALWKRLFDTDTEVPSYFLTTANTSEFDEAKVLPDATIAGQFYQLAPNSSGQSSRVSVNFATGRDPGMTQYVFRPCTTSGRIYVKPCTAAAGCAYPSATTAVCSLAGASNRNAVTYTSIPSPTVLDSSTPPHNPAQGYFGGSGVYSPMFISQKQAISPKMQHKDTSCGGLLFGSPGVVTVPISGPVTLRQTGYQRVITHQQQPAVVPAVVIKEQTSSSREPPPLRLIQPSHLQEAAVSQNLSTRPQQTLVATKIIKAFPVAGASTQQTTTETKQKPLSLQFSITTNQKLNLAKGQILTTATGERYLINEVTTTLHQGDGTVQEKVIDSGQQGK